MVSTSMIAMAIAAFAIGSSSAFMPTTMSSGHTTRQHFIKSAGLASGAALGGVVAANAMPWQVKKNPSLLNIPKPEDPNILPDAFQKVGPGPIVGDPLSARDVGVAKKLEMRAEDKIEERNKTGPKSGNRDVEKRMEANLDNASAKPLTL